MLNSNKVFNKGNKSIVLCLCVCVCVCVCVSVCACACVGFVCDIRLRFLRLSEKGPSELTHPAVITRIQKKKRARGGTDR